MQVPHLRALASMFFLLRRCSILISKAKQIGHVILFREVNQQEAHIDHSFFFCFFISVKAAVVQQYEKYDTMTTTVSELSSCLLSKSYM